MPVGDMVQWPIRPDPAPTTCWRWDEAWAWADVGADAAGAKGDVGLLWMVGYATEAVTATDAGLLFGSTTAGAWGNWRPRPIEGAIGWEY